MIEQQTADLGSLIDALSSQGAPPDTDALTKVAKAVAKLFGVDPDEVAVLRLNAKGKTLRFVIPEKLAAVGTIPLSSATALAARTARERRPELVNNFSTARHATVFEGVPLGRDPAEMIQKIMSAPILDGAQVLRRRANIEKGPLFERCGPGFYAKGFARIDVALPHTGAISEALPGRIRK